MSSPNTIVLVAGPTGVGKTALALKLAERLDTSILSADSRQCYREMNIGVARPTPQELIRVPHYFIASHSIRDHITAGSFARYARDVAEKVFSGKKVLVLAGGTGLYIKAFTEGIDEMPHIPDVIRKTIREGYENNGLAWLQAEARTKDPAWYKTGEVQNPHRLMRALEVLEATGRSIREFQTMGLASVNGGAQAGNAKEVHVVKIGLELPREQLYDQINRRVDKMMEQGLLDEVRGLMPYRSEKALETVGYKELFAHLDGDISLDKAVEAIKQHTRNYAKRQLTWFKRDPEIRWFSPAQGELAETYVLQHLPSVS